MQDNDTLQVLESNTTEATIPNNTHILTLDLNGFTLTHTQPIINSGTLTITDSDPQKKGLLQSVNTTSSAPAIDNTGTLNIEAGTIVGAYYSIANSGTYNQTGGTVKATGAMANAAIYSTSGSVAVSNATIIAENRESNKSQSLRSIYIRGGSLTVNDSNIDTYNDYNSAYGIQEDSNASLAVTIRGKVNITAESTSGTSYGISGGKVLMSKTTSGSPTVTASSRNYAYGIYTDTATNSEISDVTVVATSTNSEATGVQEAKALTDSTITVNARSAAYGARTVRSLTNNTIDVASHYSSPAYGIYGRNITVVSGNTTVHADNANAYGYYSSTSSNYSGTFTIQGGNVTAATDGDGKLAYGYYAPNYSTSYITGGTITGQHYGAYLESNTDYQTYIGEDDGTIYNGYDNQPANPVITGGHIGVYGGNVNFYDGQLRGIDAAYYNRNIKTIATDSYMHMTQVDDYEVKYVSTQEWLAKIGDVNCDSNATDHCYLSLQAAINAAETGDEITLLKDNYIFSSTEFPADKELTIELDGNTIITGVAMHNRGNTTIQNSKANARPLIEYYENNDFITNYSGAELTFKNVDIKAERLVSNKSDATFTLNNTSVEYSDNTSSTSYIIASAGTVNILNGSTITTEYGIINQTGGSTAIDHSALTIAGVKNNTASQSVRATHGTVTINNSTVTALDYASGNSDSDYALNLSNETAGIVTESTLSGKIYLADTSSLSVTDSAIYNNHQGKTVTMSIAANASATFNHTEMNLVPYGRSSSGAPIINQGKLELKNGSIAKIISTNTNHRGDSAVIYNSGSLNVDNSSITMDMRGMVSDNGTRYGIYNAGANSKADILNDSSISVSSDGIANHYAIYIENSDISSAGGIQLSDSTLSVNSPNAYGVQVVQGKFTMGEKETVQIGEDIANKTMPLVQAISSTDNGVGYGVIKQDGIFNFYDGKIIGSTHSRTATITETEYWYEAVEDIDQNGNEFSVLRYMRTQQTGN